MLTVKHPFARRQPANRVLLSSSEEEQRAKGQGVTVEVYRLQERLRKLPLVPRQDWLKKKRAELVDRLFVTARRDRCLSQVNPWAACDSTVLPIRH
jgi:hypothetical protein